MFTKSEREIISKALGQLDAIPSEDFLNGEFTNSKNKCCAIGHLNRLDSANPSDYSEKNCDDKYIKYDGLDEKGHVVRQLSQRFINNGYENLATVNNGHCMKYRQEGIKERVIACLEDMLKTEEVAEAVEA